MARVSNARGYYITLKARPGVRAPNSEQSASLRFEKLNEPFILFGTNHPGLYDRIGTEVTADGLGDIDPGLYAVFVKAAHGNSLRICRNPKFEFTSPLALQQARIREQELSRKLDQLAKEARDAERELSRARECVGQLEAMPIKPEKGSIYRSLDDAVREQATAQAEQQKRMEMYDRAIKLMEEGTKLMAQWKASTGQAEEED